MVLNQYIVRNFVRLGLAFSHQNGNYIRKHNLKNEKKNITPVFE